MCQVDNFKHLQGLKFNANPRRQCLPLPPVHQNRPDFRLGFLLPLPLGLEDGSLAFLLNKISPLFRGVRQTPTHLWEKERKLVFHRTHRGRFPEPA